MGRQSPIHSQHRLVFPFAFTPELDHVAVERAVRGDSSTQLTVPELVEVLQRLDDGSRSARMIARIAGVTPRTVTRHRRRRRERSMNDR